MDEKASAAQIQIDMITSKLERLCYMSKTKPYNKKVNEQFLILQDKRTTLIRNEVAKHFQIDINKQKQNQIKDLRRFWTLSGKLLTQEGRISLLSEELSKDEKRKRRTSSIYDMCLQNEFTKKYFVRRCYKKLINFRFMTCHSVPN